MIGINECVADVAKIRDEHINFVGGHSKKIIDFYYEFIVAIQTGKNLGNAKFIANLEAIKRKHRLPSPQFFRLVNPLLNSRKLRSVNDVVFLKRSKNTVPQLSDRGTVDDLKSLGKNISDLIALDLSQNSAQRKYKTLQNRYKRITFLAPSIIDYDRWFSSLPAGKGWGPYQLTQKIGLGTCPYCNRSFTFTIVKKNNAKVARPQLDHFLSKTRHPWLALSFYNLIPCCSICNASIKGNTDIAYSSHLNPYETNTRHSLIRFSYKPRTYEASIGMDNDLEIVAKYNGSKSDLLLEKKVNGNIDLFCLNEIYKNHNDAVQEIIFKRHIANDAYIQTLQKTFPELNVSFADAYKIAFGNYFAEELFHRRPLSKLTKDIAFELKTLEKYK